MFGAWWGAARTSPAAVLGARVGVGVNDGTVCAVGMIGSGSTKDLVGGLAG